MKFTIDPARLLEIFQAASCNLGSDGGGPLSDFLFVLKDGALTVSSCDGATTLSFTVDVEGDREDGSLCLPAKFLTEAVKEFQDIEGPVIFTADGTHAVIDWGSGRCSLPVHDASGRPEPRSVDPGLAEAFSLDAADVLAALRATAFAAQTTGVNDAVNAVNVRCEDDGTVTFAATDTRLLSTCKVTSATAAAVQFSIPILVAGKMVRLFRRLEGETVIASDGKNFLVTCGGMTMASYVLPYKYPDYVSVMSRERGVNVFAVEVPVLLSCVRRVLALDREAVGFFSLSHDVTGLHVGAKVPDRKAEFSETIEAECAGGDIEVLLSALQMEEILRNVPFRRLRLVVDRPNLPCFLEDADDGVRMTMMLMPVPGK